MEKRYKVIFSIVLTVLFGCEGSFSPNEIAEMGILTQINLTAPPSNDVCLTEGLNANGDWLVQFEWITDVPFSGTFNLVLLRDGVEELNQPLNPGDELTLEPNTIYQWRVSAEGENIVSDTSTFVTPAPRNENGTNPPTLSSIQMTPVGMDFDISYTVLDADGDLLQSELFIDGILLNNFGQENNVSQTINLPTGESTILVVATDQEGNETTSSRTYIN